MEADAINEVQLQRQRMLRSQGPLHANDTTHLNPANCYIRSYDCKQRCNVNASFNPVGLLIREKRRKVVTEISALLGHYSGDWYASSLRPRNLPLHPLDWSTCLLQQICDFAKSLPTDVTIEQRILIAHQAMHQESLQTSECKTLAPLTGNSALETAAVPHDATATPPGSERDVASEKTWTEYQQAMDQVSALSEETQALRKDLKCERAALALRNHEFDKLLADNAWLERDVALFGLKEAGMQNKVEQMQKTMIEQKARLSFF